MDKIKRTRFRVTGTQYYQKDFVDKLGKYEYDYDEKASVLKEEYNAGDRIYQYYLTDLKAELVPEPDNEFDSNAVKVVVNGIQVGYIKKGSCSRAKNLMKSPDFAGIDVDIIGGKYKQLFSEEDDNSNEKIRIERFTDPYYVDIDILSREKAKDSIENEKSLISLMGEMAKPVANVENSKSSLPFDGLQNKPTNRKGIILIFVLLVILILTVVFWKWVKFILLALAAILVIIGTISKK